MAKPRRFETVRLSQDVGTFRAGQLGAVVEVYTTPYEAYDVEIVDDDGQTKGMLEALGPEQVEAARTVSAAKGGTDAPPVVNTRTAS